jgi:hypothetical protein
MPNATVPPGMWRTTTLAKNFGDVMRRRAVPSKTEPNKNLAREKHWPTKKERKTGLAQKFIVLSLLQFS